MGMHLIIVSEKFIKTVLLWNAGCSTAANSPFPKSPGGISFSFEHTCQSRFICPDGGVSVVHPHGHISGMQTRE